MSHENNIYNKILCTKYFGDIYFSDPHCWVLTISKYQTKKKKVKLRDQYIMKNKKYDTPLSAFLCKTKTCWTYTISWCDLQSCLKMTDTPTYTFLSNICHWSVFHFSLNLEWKLNFYTEYLWHLTVFLHHQPQHLFLTSLACRTPLLLTWKIKAIQKTLLFQTVLTLYKTHPILNLKSNYINTCYGELAEEYTGNLDMSLFSDLQRRQ